MQPLWPTLEKDTTESIDSEISAQTLSRAAAFVK